MPLSNASSIGSTLIWDDTGLVTAVAIVNPSAVDTTVAVSIKDTTGALIGTTAVNLAAKNKDGHRSEAFARPGSNGRVSGAPPISR